MGTELHAAHLIDRTIENAVKEHIGDCILADVQRNGEMIHYVDGSTVFLYLGEPLVRLLPTHVEFYWDEENLTYTAKVTQKYERLYERKG